VTRGVCTVCAHRGAVELHHVCGRRHAPSLVALVCLSCHRYLHAGLRAAGVRLDAAGATPPMRRYAVTVGILDLLLVAFQSLGRADVVRWLRSIRRRVVDAVRPPRVVTRPSLLVGESPPTRRRVSATTRRAQRAALAHLVDHASALIGGIA
jgi:hypothetical protein